MIFIFVFKLGDLKATDIEMFKFHRRGIWNMNDAKPLKV